MAAFVLLAHLLCRTRPFGAVVPAIAPRSFNAQLEGLRGLLALSVFFHHAIINRNYRTSGQWADPSTLLYEHLGLTAVALFFFLTGFLFWTKLRDQGRLSPWRFYVARARRLGPAYLGSVALILVVVAIRSDLHLRVPLATLFVSILKWCTFGMLRDDFPDVNLDKETLLINAGVAWTLRWEWIYYLILPALAWFARGRRVVLLAVAIVPFLLPRELRRSIAVSPGGDLLLTFLRYMAFGFFPGMLASYLVRWQPIIALARHRWIAVVPWLSLILYACFAPARFGFKTYFLLLPFVLIACGADAFGFLTSRALQFLGRISYSVYLLHGIALTVAFLLIRDTDVASFTVAQYWIFMGAIGAVIILGSAISYLYLEAPWLAASTKRTLTP